MSTDGGSTDAAIRRQPHGGVVDSLPGDPDVDDAITEVSFLRGVVSLAAAIARAQADHGDIPLEAAEAIGAAAGRVPSDIRRIGMEAPTTDAAVTAVVAALRQAVGEPFSEFVHRGLTSQDCVDTAFSLTQAKALDVIGPRLALVIGRLSRVAERHAATPMLARTLDQSAAPVTFGWKVCGWIEGLERAALNLGRTREMLSLQVGGAAGDLAEVGAHPHAILKDVAEMLELDLPRTPWHSERSRVLQLAAALTQVISACASVADDIAAMASAETAELRLGGNRRQREAVTSSATSRTGHGAATAALIRSASLSAPGLLATVAAAAGQRHGHAGGAWQAEWRTVRELVHLAGGSAFGIVLLEQDIEVDAERMAANLARAGGGASAAAAHRRAVEYLQRFGD